MKSVLSVNDISKKDFLSIIKTAKKLKKSKKYPQTLKGKNIALIFQKPSTRTRVSFEVAVEKLCGNAIVLNTNDLQLARGETIEDTIRTLERYVDLVAARVFYHSDLIKMANISKIPIINLLSDYEHPLQALADILTMDEKIGLKNIEKIVYVGDGRNNVCHSLILSCVKLGLKIYVASPKAYLPEKEFLINDLVFATENVEEAVKNADVIYTDVWVSMGMEKEREERLKIFRNYQVNEKLVSLAKRNYIFMHCLPAHRGEEVVNNVIDSKNSVVFDQAENRLWTSMALLIHIFK
ncbi:MAG: ornithine carbamoyltransferase [Candidatus Aenigmatarchaeota archaeon]